MMSSTREERSRGGGARTSATTSGGGAYTTRMPALEQAVGPQKQHQRHDQENAPYCQAISKKPPRSVLDQPQPDLAATIGPDCQPSR